MAYDNETVLAAREELERRRLQAENSVAILRARLCERIPRIREIEGELAGAVPQVAHIILNGGDAGALQEVQKKNLALQEELATLLHRAGYGGDNFEPRYTCPRCKDTGYEQGKMCDCFRSLLKEEACRRLSRLSALQLTTFDGMDLSYYDTVPDGKTEESPRQWMEDIIAFCRDYAENFSADAESLLFRGATGTGKTHLSLAIAKQVAESGYGVVYGSVQPLLRQMESEHFGRSEGNTEEQLSRCDLLVLDDLGMELDSPFYRSCIYSLLNTRLLERRPTIISTNLTFSALQERYGDQIASRITGGFTPLLCVGRDIRQLRRKRQMQ